MVLQLLRDATVLEYVQCESFSFSWLCIQEFKGQYRFPDRYVYHSHRAVFDCTIRRRGIPYRSFKLERLGDHCRFDFAGTVDR